MPSLTRADLFSLEHYAEIRASFREEVMAHKAKRRLALGPNAALYFESLLTVKYQVQEMLRIERIFERAAIEEELAVYSPLIPDGQNWKATFMIEFSDPDERRVALTRMVGIEDTVWLGVSGHPPVRSIANEDLPRSTADKTAAVHFLRFEPDRGTRSALFAGAPLLAGIDHPAYPVRISVPEPVRAALLADLTP